MDETDKGKTVEFHYLKSRDFRTVYAEGVIGSSTPSDRIVCAFYNERAAMPNYQKFSLKDDGDIDKLIDAEGKTGFIRELEVALSMDRDMAEALVRFLSDRIAEVDSEEN